MKLHAKTFTEKFDFVGWIPCVIGRLDFSKFSTDQLTTSSNEPHSFPICFSYSDEHSFPSLNSRTRVNVASSVFDWKDRDDKENLYDGNFRFITIASTNEAGSMIGNAYLVLDSDIKRVASFVEKVS